MVRSIFVISRSGFSARLISADRPQHRSWLLFLMKVFDAGSIFCGVYPFVINRVLTSSGFRIRQKLLKKLKLGAKGDYILLLAGLTQDSVSTNSILVHRVS